MDYVGEDVVFAVPGGNFGNAYACWVARKMGLPIHTKEQVTVALEKIQKVFRQHGLLD
ncbi:MAG: hypothetical protein ACI4UW_07565 [Muribaculaceae bacterium]